MDHAFASLQQDSTLDRAASDYDRDGVIRVRGLLSSADIASVRAALARYAREIAPSLPPSDVVFEADGVAVRNLWRMEHHDPFFAELCGRPEIRRMVGRLVHGEPILLGVETFNKPARVGSGVPAHQDNAYFCQSPPDVLTIWISIDAATEANGPIFYIRGSHSTGMLAHQPSGVAGNSMGLAVRFDKSDPFVGTLEAGDALIHHCQTIHYSAPTKTDHPRCGLLLVFRGSHTQDDPQLREKYTQARPA
jgi:ectoine hydroxylase-related dioxygenase (phytanoyl-CoA dioxygenase family)